MRAAGKGRLTRLLVAGNPPGVIAGSIVRVEFLPSARAFDAVISAVLTALGEWLLIRPQIAVPPARSRQRLPAATIVAFATIVGCVGGIYGIGGGSILAPVLISSGHSRP